jgi:hypothetical protein
VNPLAGGSTEGRRDQGGTLKRESKELEIVWRVTVFEQCGWRLLLSFARSLVCNFRYPVRVNFVWAKVRLERYHVAMGYSPVVSCLHGIEESEGSIYLNCVAPSRHERNAQNHPRSTGEDSRKGDTDRGRRRPGGRGRTENDASGWARPEAWCLAAQPQRRWPR